MLTASHFGDVGDLLAAMSCFEALSSDGIDLVLYPAPGRCREPFTPEKVERLRPLLELQPYISRVRFSDKPEGVILDKWRHHYARGFNLADLFAKAFGLPYPDRQKPWLRVDEPKHVADVVVHRSPRYRDRSRFPWQLVMREYRGRLVMVGSVEEHAAFCKEVGPIPYHHTPNMLDLARVIAGAKLFVGNQSSPYWVATGLMRPTWLEQLRGKMHNCHWLRPDAFYDVAKPPKL